MSSDISGAGYSGTPLPTKLGIKAGHRVLLDGAPAGFSLVPEHEARISRRLGPGPYDVIVCFCPDRARFDARFELLSTRITTAGALWACWPKKASGIATDIGERYVHEHGLATGLVDVKVAAIDGTWSGFKFVRRLADRA